MSRFRSALAYWPLLVVAATVAVLGIVLDAAGQGWPLRDWVGTVYLSFAITIATIVLARRQGLLQEALADLELMEKVAVLYRNTSGVYAEPSPGTVISIVLDSRSGLRLAMLARPSMRREYLDAVNSALTSIRGILLSSVVPYQRWRPEEWSRLRQTLAWLDADLADVMQGNRRVDRAPMAEVLSHSARLQDLLMESRAPFSLFQSWFTHEPNHIRVRVNWPRLQSMADGVRITVATLRLGDGGLDRLYAPWYRGSNGGEVPWDHTEARPWDFAGIRQDSGGLSEQRLAKIGEIRHNYQRNDRSRPIKFCVATYDLGDAGRLVLDGNHRLSAAVGILDADVFIEVTEFRVNAPIDPGIVPDLVHWAARPPSD